MSISAAGYIADSAPGAAIRTAFSGIGFGICLERGDHWLDGIAERSRSQNVSRRPSQEPLFPQYLQSFRWLQFFLVTDHSTLRHKIPLLAERLR